MLQRRFRIGYNRSARLVDMMEERGMVAPSDGTNKPRKVLMTESQVEAYLAGSGAPAGVPAADGFAGAPAAETQRGAMTDVKGAEIAPVSHAVYGGVPGGEPVGGPMSGPDDGDEDEPITDISDLIGDDEPPFVSDGD
jgi:hypothetical protein